MRAASISVYSTKKTPFCLRCSICCSPAGMGFLLWASAIIGFLSPTCMGHSTSVFSRYREDRSSVHGATACNYSLISTRINSLTCGFANCSKATCADSLAIAAAGNRAADAVLEYSLRGRGGFACGGFGRAAHLVLCACEHEAPVIRADVIPPCRRGDYQSSDGGEYVRVEQAGLHVERLHPVFSWFGLCVLLRAPKPIDKGRVTGHITRTRDSSMVSPADLAGGSAVPDIYNMVILRYLGEASEYGY